MSGRARMRVRSSAPRRRDVRAVRAMRESPRESMGDDDDRVVFLSREVRIRKYLIDCGDRLEWKQWYVCV